MTIKEAEEALGVPRATIRFYEKEKLLDPKRAENGYRDYSEEDIERLKKIIILRKLGIAVSDIEELFDGVKDMPQVLSETISDLERQMEELQGAVSVCRKMQQENLEFRDFDAERYWNVIDEEEKKGNQFMDIAKDFVQMEKGIVNSCIGWTDENGELYGSWKKNLFSGCLVIIFFGLCFCLLKRTWTFQVFAIGCCYFFAIMLTRCLLAVPVYLLGKKFPWVKKHSLFMGTLFLIVIVFILLLVLQI